MADQVYSSEEKDAAADKQCRFCKHLQRDFQNSHTMICITAEIAPNCPKFKDIRQAQVGDHD